MSAISCSDTALPRDAGESPVTGSNATDVHVLYFGMTYHIRSAANPGIYIDSLEETLPSTLLDGEFAEVVLRGDDEAARQIWLREHPEESAESHPQPEPRTPPRDRSSTDPAHILY